MANFLPQNSSPFGQMNLYTPDWSFLTTVMGTRQKEYDTGFNQVKSAYDSLKNAPLTNGDNAEYREAAFKKLESNIKSISNLDLSQGENITKALNVMSPIVEDDELAYDMWFTKKENAQMQRLNSYKNSTDPEIRKQFNKHAEMRIQYANLDMQEAKRGDGSIMEVRPKDFVAFQDYVGDLDKKMKAAGIKMKVSDIDPSGYIIETTNGPMSIPYFNAWAKMQMGDTYNEQFAVMGEVQVESAVRAEMQRTGVSKAQAKTVIAQKMQPLLIEKERDRVLAYDKDYQSVLSLLKVYETSNGGEIPVNKAEHYKELRLQKESIKEQTEYSLSEAAKLNDDPDYVLANLNSFFASSAKDQEIGEWATATAMVTTEQEYSADEVALHKWDNALKRQFHNEKMAWDQKKFLLDLQYKYDTADGTGSGSSGGSGSGSSNTQGGFNFTSMGNYIPPEGEAFSADYFMEAYTASETALFNSTFEQGGLLDYVTCDVSEDGEPGFDNIKQNEVRNAIKELQAYANTHNAIGGDKPFFNKEALSIIIWIW